MYFISSSLKSWFSATILSLTLFSGILVTTVFNVYSPSDIDRSEIENPCLIHSLFRFIFIIEWVAMPPSHLDSFLQCREHTLSLWHSCPNSDAMICIENERILNDIPGLLQASLHPRCCWTVSNFHPAFISQRKSKEDLWEVMESGDYFLFLSGDFLISFLFSSRNTNSRQEIL